VTRVTLRADFVAGLISAFVVLPQGVAYATLAGMPPQYGLYCAMLPAIVAALWGRAGTRSPDRRMRCRSSSSRRWRRLQRPARTTMSRSC
jgi:hypothetical protein